MILEYKNIELYGKTVFVKAKIKVPHTDVYSIPSNACFLHMSNGELEVFSEHGVASVKYNQSVLMKCGIYPTHFNNLPKDGVTEVLVIHFHIDVLRKIYEEKLPSFLNGGTDISPISMATIEASTLINKYIADFHYYFNHPRLIKSEILVLKIKEIILLLLQTENSDKIKTILKNLFNKQTLDFKNLIENHILSEISIKELALLSNLSLSSFKQKFKIHYNTSPAKYILVRRLEKAKELLEYSDRSVSEICYDAGFSNLSHFSKKFKEAYGYSPSQVKKAN